MFFLELFLMFEDSDTPQVEVSFLRVVLVLGIDEVDAMRVFYLAYSLDLIIILDYYLFDLLYE